MDRSFLSDPGVVAASRDFGCARLLTYESEAEADFLKDVFIGGSGDLENTTFAFLAPDGKTPLTRAGRAPNHIFRGDNAVQAMAEKMKELSAKYPAKAEARELPY